MSYQAQYQLETNVDFQGRSRAAAISQAEVYQNDQRPDFVALASGILKDAGGYTQAFTRIDAGGPGIADKVDNGDGTIDQSKVTDADLLSLTQANFPVVAGLYFNDDGTPIEGV
jgi:hypothetical protein